MSKGEGRTEDLLRAMRSTVKEAVWLTTSHHRGQNNDVALFATRRGGSTWLMHVIGAAPGFRSLDQPFSVMTANLTPGHYRRVPKFAFGEIVCPAQDDLEGIHNYVESLLAGDIPVNAPYRIWRRDFRFRTSRQVLKIVGAKSLIVWMDDEFDLDIVLLTRHPITQAMSCIRNGWTLTVHAYLDNPRFVSEYLTPELEGRCHDIVNDGSALEKFVLNWGLENLIPLRAVVDRPSWTMVSYEAAVRRPGQMADELAARLGLGSASDLLDAVHRPSRTSHLSTAARRTAMGEGDENTLLREPLEAVGLDERRRAMRILEHLGIDHYRPDEIEPMDTR